MSEAGKRLRRLYRDDEVEDSVHLGLLVDEVEAEAVSAERARIRAAVERLLSFDIRVDRALTPFDGPDYSGRYDMPPGEVVITALPGQGGLVDRAAVLAAIEGETT